MEQVSFLHIYHHFTITWAWWIGLSLCAGGDSYFGALLNSWIHVMMYSYYAMSLLKIPCPWKRYLTLAQLTQFSTVVLYSIITTVIWTYSYQNLGWKPYAAVGVQVWEMLSLFVLFTFFYKKSYGSNATAKVNKIESRNGTMKSCAAALDAVAKDAQGVVSNASKGVQKVVSNACMTPPGQSVMSATNKPSWSIINM